MAIIDAGTLVRHAHEHDYAVAQVNTNGGTYDLTRAIVEVAEEEQAPVILGAYEANLTYRGFEFPAMQMRYFAERADAPLAVHLDHGHSAEACQRAIDAGFTSVMIDGSKLPLEQNLEQTRRVVEIAHPHGVSVEAEIGELQELNPDGSISEVKNLSKPEEVQRMCADSGADMIAVGIGTAHGFYKGQPEIRFDLLEEHRRVCKLPLVLHGSTGLADPTIQKCVSMGMAKVNLGTLIRTRYVEYTRAVIEEDQHKNHPWRVGQAVKDRIKDHVRHIIHLTASVGRAKDLAAHV